ncbi:MAG: primosomal protein N' [Nitrospiraceae bacterium]|nr:primosomal protein N' [Nitrospiraceae bacterium]
MVSTQAASPRTEPEALFADVIVPRHLAGPFTYTVPLSLRHTLRIGYRVLVPFGRSILQGAVIALSHVLPQGLDRTRLKEISSVLPEGAATYVSSNLFQLSRQVAEQYVAPWGQCLRLVLPPAPNPRAQVSHYELTEQGRAALAAREPSSVKARALLARLGKTPLGLRRSSRSPGPAELLHDLKARGWVVEVQDRPSASAAPLPLARSSRQPNQGNSGMAPLIPDPAMSWADPLFEALRAQGPTRVLVQAPWTDRLGLLQQAVRLVLDRRQTVLIIVGEAERAQWVTGLIRDDESGISPVCFHSGLSDQVKAEMWDQIHRQIVRVVVGTRSSIFLPLTAIGAIWVEGEEDAALKEPQEPRYHAREVAWLRAQDEQAVLVMSSSHPSLETRAAMEQRGIVVRKLVPCDARPSIQVVDLRDYGRGAVLTQPLVLAIEQAIGRRAGVLLFLNRKGYAGALVCRDCGQVPRCPACRVALMYSRQAGRLLCSYCGDVAPIPETCGSCSGPRMQLIGEGTERVEEDAKRLFPQAAVIRLDGDTMRRPAQAKALWRRVEQGEWDIIVGTQLLLRRGPLPMMGLVGIVQADAGLNVPDFRSAERTYHTLLDAVSLAGSAGVGGKVIVQTYLSSHHAIQAVAQNDESVFLSEELSHRIALGYPPAVYLIALLVSGTNEKMVRDAATAWVARLTACASPSVAGSRAAAKVPLMAPLIGQPDCLTVLGPVPSPVSRLRGRYRWQILVKSSEREAGLDAVRSTVKDMEQTHQRRAVKFDVDVDPVEMW